MIYFLIGIAGALGAMLRYVIGIIFFTNSIFPFTTLFINVIGSFILARLTYGFFKNTSQEVRIAIGTGFLGSFTTFSAVSIETLELFQNGNVLLGLLYIFLSIFGGLFMSQLGFKMIKEVPKG